MIESTGTNVNPITPRALSLALTLGTILFPCIGLIGWICNMPTLASLHERLIPMAPSTAICFIVLSIMLMLHSFRKDRFVIRISIISFCVAIFGLLTALDPYVGGASISPDNWFWPFMGTLGSHALGRMAPLSGLLFFLSSVSLICLNGGFPQKKHFAFQRVFAAWLGGIVSFLGLAIVIGYALGSPLFYNGNIIPMALPSALSFMLYGAALALFASFQNKTPDQAFDKIIGNMKISTQIRLGFNLILLFIILLGIVVVFQAESLWQGTKGIYEHPLKVQRALGEIKNNVDCMSSGMKNLFLAANDSERLNIAQDIDSAEANATNGFTELYGYYLGPKADIDAASISFVKWKALRNNFLRLLQTGRIHEALGLIKADGTYSEYVDNLMAQLKVVNDFSIIKADYFYKNALIKKKNLTFSLTILVMILLLLTFAIVNFLLGKIRTPLSELIRSASEFKNGNFETRCAYSVGNEFGTLAETFNTLAENVRMNLDLSNKTAHLASLMLSEYEAKKFFQATLKALSEHTGSQMTAIYLRSDDNKSFEHFESTGIDSKARQSFAADTLEGEFGFAISSRKVQHLKDIPVDTRFVFHTVTGMFIPREIITLPITADGKVIAVISLASVNSYSAQSLQLIDNILVTLCTRVEGILAYHKIKEFSDQLKNQNIELQAQQSELSAQSTELTEQNRELEIQKQQLDEASRLKTTFLSNMSHELRTPLNSVIALSGVLNRRLLGKLPDEEYGFLSVIERNGKMLLALINDVLDIARIESGREELEISKFSTSELIDEIVELIEPQAKQKNIMLVHQKVLPSISLESDIDKCRHILQNIIGNAVKFTEQGSVTVSATQNGHIVEISITDTGIGIALEHQSHIFDEFRQADESTSRRYGGTGLGLAIAKKYTQVLGGDILVKSTLGKGSTFTLRLPLLASSIKSSHQETRSLPPLPKSSLHNNISVDAPKNNPTILLVDDSEPAIIQLKDILAEHSYRILVAHNGLEALAAIEKEIPDAIILDLMMPEIDGFTVLKTVRDAERTASVPVLILTAKHITKEELKFLKRNNIHQLIQKGDVNRNQLLESIAAMVNPQTAASQKPPRPLAVIDSKPVVLVVEDNPDNMITMKALLGESYIILEATTGQTGVLVAHDRKPHLILMDISLPEKDGVEAFKAIRNSSDTAHIPIIAVTASAMTTDRETILAFGFDAYIAKPIESQILFARINEVLYGK